MTQPPPPPNQPPGPPPNQPPGPPDQPPGPPPQGGFGAPQDVPPGGFGAPAPPPQGAPGYGYPQAPQDAPGYGYPQAPQDAPGYGYPQAPQPPQPPHGPQPPAGPPAPPAGQPGGYGHPAQPPTQPSGPMPGQAAGQPPAYGYPTAPMHQAAPQPGMPGMPGMPGAPAGQGRGKLSASMKIVIAAAVAVVLIVGTGLWYASSRGDEPATANGDTAGATTGGGGEDGGAKAPGGGGKEKPPANTQAKVAFQIPAPVVTDTTTTKGSWLTEKTYVKSGVNEVVGYDPLKGTKLWTVPLPGEICAASRHVKDGRAALVFQPSKPTAQLKYPPCSEVGVIDLDAGKLAWTKTVEGGTGGDRKARWEEVTIGANTVAAGGTDGGAAWDLATGKEYWRPQPNAEGCKDLGYGGGEGLVAVRQCGDSGNKHVLVQNLAPTTGAPISTYKMPAGVEYAAVVSTKPLVAAADVGRTAGDGSGISDFFSIDETTGKLKVKIAADASRYAGKCRSTNVEECEKLVVGNNRLYLPTENHEGSGEDYNRVNELVAFDLTTGKLVGRKLDSGANTTVFPVRMDGGNVIAYKSPGYERGGQLVSVDGATFQETVLLKTPADRAIRTAETLLADREDLIYRDGRLYMADYFVSKPSTVVKETRYLALVFTTE
ncbi:PQQ-like beta-propeller repeat protein [Streptomyces sp. DH12]|uniref:PQQ-like beta-propeller repeat protein n=1 Tax=Streptomyces sp. DH12 TaxID=2857010 RepID=UPI001E4BE8F0|nr:PQQ-like beta-propeller repeat protein [Streptomyces sp. DH12]